MNTLTDPLADHRAGIEHLRQQVADLKAFSEGLQAGADSLRKQLDAEREIVDKVWRALGVETFEQANGKTIWELVAALAKAKVGK